MIQANPVASMPIPPDVTAFAAEQGVSAELPVVVEMTRRLFPEAEMFVQTEDDPEIANDRHIVIVTRPTGLSVDDALELLWEWHRQMFLCCPATLVCVFRLGLELS